MKVAAIDIGTNSVRLLVMDADSDVDLERATVITRLGQGVDRHGFLHPDAMTRTLAVLDRYAAALERHHVDRVRAVATSACRDAANAADFLDAAQRSLGFRPDVIGGDQEAHLAFAGAVADLPVHGGPYLVIDVGGGSTEFVFGDEEPRYARSVDVGSVRITERLMPDRPVPAAQLAAATEEVRRLLAGVQLPGPPRLAIGAAGTFTSLAAIHLRLTTYSREAVHGTTLSMHDLAGLVDRLAGLTLAETEAIPSLDPARAPVIAGGALVAASCLPSLGLDRIVVRTSSILDGIALGLLAQDPP